MKNHLLPTAIFVLFTIQSLTAREFTATDGRKIEAEVVAIRDGSVVIKRGTKQYTLPQEKFSAADQEFFKEWKKNEQKNKIPKLDIDIATGKSDRNDKSDGFDDRKGSFEFTIKVTNEEIGYNLENASATLAVLGEDCEDRKKFCIMQKSNFTVNAAEGETSQWKGKAFNYLFDNRPPAYWGSEYCGYALQIKNASGKVIFSKSMPAKFEGHTDKILSLGVESAFDSKLKGRGSADIRTK